jgi:hypothetical protein
VPEVLRVEAGSVIGPGMPTVRSCADSGSVPSRPDGDGAFIAHGADAEAGLNR